MYLWTQGMMDSKLKSVDKRVVRMAECTFCIFCVYMSSTLYKFLGVSYLPLYIVRNIK
jgi:hypothetical protein